MSASNQTILTKFLKLLNAADAVRLTASPCLTNWDVEDIANDPESQIVSFSWTDEDGDFHDSYSEGEIAQGHFAPGGKFVFDDGDEIIFFKQTPIETLDQPYAMSNADNAMLFWEELFASHDSLEMIGQEHGAVTLATLMYLQNAILKNTFIELSWSESAVLNIVRGFPSGAKWELYITIEVEEMF